MMTMCYLAASNTALLLIFKVLMWPWYKLLPAAAKQHNKPTYTKVRFCISTFKRLTMPEYNFLSHTTIYGRLYVTHRSNMFPHKLPKLGMLSLVSKSHCKTNAYLSLVRWYKTHLLKSNTAQIQVKTFVCLFLAQQPPVGHGPLIHEVSISHTATHHSW